MTYKTLHIKQNIEYHESYWKSGLNAGAPEELVVPAQPVAPIRFTLVTNTMISLEWGKERKVLMTNGTYTWSFVTQILIHKS
jgi:hypothetical protein